VRVVFAGGGTGGHLYPALAIARALVEQRPIVQPLFVGAHRGVERTVLPTTEFRHVLLDVHPLYRARPWENWRTLRGGLRSWGMLSRALGTERPALVVGTGGYAASVMLAWCVAKGIPFVLQEQNSVAGLTVRLFARWAREIYVAFPEVVAMLPSRAMSRAQMTGNPVQPPPDPRPDRAAARAGFGLPPDGPVLLVFGGSQGSAALNQRVDALVTQGLPAGVNVLWATGPAHHARHTGRASDRVVVRDYLGDIAQAYSAADLALTRAGAMTTAELCAWGIPMVLVPLPTAAANHQVENARSLAAAGAARWIPEHEATPTRLAQELAALLSDDATRAELAAGAAARGRPGAARDIAARIGALLDAEPA
jgi:UDP-N-acetylglucosamine--N-acetylmuramyl-(pentapeptide) pyrophosphoryl-undecaprenol N-acetylglucosamine transferase